MGWAMFLVAALVVALVRVASWRMRTDLLQIPLLDGTVPIVGNIRALKALQSHTFHLLSPEHAAAAGQRGVLRLCLAGTTVLILTTPAAFAAALRKTGFLPKPLSVYAGVMLFGMKRHPIFSVQDAVEHGRLRKHLTRCFNADTVTQSIHRLTSRADDAISRICAVAAGSASPDGLADVDIGLQRGDTTDAGVLVDTLQFASTTILAALKVFIGIDLQPPVKALYETLEQASATSTHPLQYSLLKRGLYPGYRRYRRNWTALYEFNCAVVREMFSKPPPDGGTTLWAALRDAFPDAMTDAAQFEDAVANVSFVYVAGYETTTNAIMHTLSALALDPASQAAIVEELRDADLLATPEQPRPPPITAERLASLKMVDVVCHESLRLFPPVPGGVRTLKQETEIGGYRVPQGTNVLVGASAMHYNKHVWGEDAMSWRPQRWLDGRSKAAIKKSPGGHARFLPFLDGATNCLGQHLALLELKMTVAMVLSRLHVTMDAQRMSHLRSVEDYLGETVTKVTLQRDTPAWLRFRPHAV